MTLGNERQIKALLNVYQAAEQNLMRKVESAVASGQLGTAAYRRQQLAEVQALLVQLQAATVPKAVALLQASYKTGLKIAGVAGVSGSFGGIHTEAVNVLGDNLSARLGQGFTNIGRQAEDVFRKEGLRLSALQLAQGDTRVAASAAMTESLVSQGVSTFVDKAGRDWGLGRYTAMVLRTTTREAVSVGTKNRLIEGGIDLVTWDASGESCLICDPLDGQTFSLTGETEGYEVLEELPPIHPNCECVLTPADVTFKELEAELGLGGQPEPSAPATPPATPSLPTAANVDASIVDDFGEIAGGPETAAKAVKGVNPLRAESDSFDAVSGNCQKATAAVEMRRRGIDAVAALGNPKGMDILDWFEGLGDTMKWNGKVTARKGDTRFAAIQSDIADSYPAGSRGTITVEWRRGRAGHIFNWERGKDGKVRFWDGQTGKEVASDSSYWTSMKQRYSTMRLDDKPITKAAENALHKREVLAAVERELAAFDKKHGVAEFEAERAAARAEVEKALEEFRAAAGKPGAASAATDYAEAHRIYLATEARIKRKMKDIQRQRTAIRRKAAK